jgi:hypothetical protein
MLPSCSLLGTLFTGAVLCALAGNTALRLAWRRRLPQYSPSRWLFDPTCAFRSSYYQDPKPRLRILAAALLGFGAVLLVTLAAMVATAQRAGADQICGFRF